eukprot:m.163970 g.163970  ORF g.163970 m.163970 type:complete len:53 (-) comp16567_c0_seq3:1117-1275(-)
MPLIYVCFDMRVATKSAVVCSQIECHTTKAKPCIKVLVETLAASQVQASRWW